MTPIFLIGYMACGKTTFGRALAKATGCEFIDLDFYIEQRFRRSIREIFTTEGEDAFRKKESAMLHEVAEFENVIVACGGGTPCFSDNMEYMLQRGEVIWLEASPERITQRLVINSSRRPLMAGKSPAEIETSVVEGLKARTPYYSRANMRFCGENLEDRRQIDNTITKFLKMHPM